MNYSEKIKQACKHLPPGCYEFAVMHDDWCKMLTGQDNGECNCDPHIAMIDPEGETDA